MARIVNRPAWITIALFVATACSPGASPPGSESPPPNGPTGSAANSAPSGSAPSASSTATEASTVDIAASLDFAEEAESAAEAMIVAADGGTVEATAADGTTFSLEVPAGALAEDTLIRMTPLADVEGVGDAPAHAVQLEPENLEFLYFARLTIMPATPIPVSDQVMFQATGTGDDVIAALVDVESEPIVVLLDHFSVAGAGSAQGQAAWLIGQTMQAQQRIGHEVGRILQEDRRRQLDEGKDSALPLDELEELFDLAERDVLGPLREAALLTCDGARAYLQALLGLQRQRELVGMGDDDTYAAAMTEAIRVVEASFTMCEREAIQKCSVKPEPEILVAFWISWDRLREFTGLPALNPDITALPERATRICRGALQFQFSGSGTARSISGSIVPIEWEYWGLLCAAGEPWQIWEEFDGIQQNSHTGAPGDDPYGPIMARFDQNGQIVESTWPPVGDLLFDPRLGGTLQGSVELQLVPGDRPTGISVTILEQQGPPIKFTEPVVPFDGSFGECPEDDGA